MSTLLRSHPALLVWIAIGIIGTLVCGCVALLMKRAGVSLRPIFWFAGFMLLVGGPQFLAHLYLARTAAKADAARAEALKEAAPAAATTGAGADSGSTASRETGAKKLFGPDADPDLIRDVRTQFGDVLAAAETAQLASLPKGETVLIAQFPSAGDAERAWVAYLRFTGLTGLAKGDSERGFAVSRPAGDRLFLLPMGRTIGVWTGADDESIRRRMVAGGFEIPRKAPLEGSTVGTASGAAGDGAIGAGSRRRLSVPVMVSLVAVWILVVVLYFFRGAAWAGSADAIAGVPPVGLGELRSRLEAVNSMDVPFQVEPGSRENEIVVTWRYADAKWIDHARAHGLRRIHRLVITLDEAQRKARVQDYSASHDWSAGRGGASINWRFSTGIVFFQHEQQTVFGVQFDEQGRLRPGTSYKYSFNLEELKQPLRLAVTRAGWTWRPVVWDGPSWLRWLTG